MSLFLQNIPNNSSLLNPITVVNKCDTLRSTIRNNLK